MSNTDILYDKENRKEKSAWFAIGFTLFFNPKIDDVRLISKKDKREPYFYVLVDAKKALSHQRISHVFEEDTANRFYSMFENVSAFSVPSPNRNKSMIIGFFNNFSDEDSARNFADYILSHCLRRVPTVNYGGFEGLQNQLLSHPGITIFSDGKLADFWIKFVKKCVDMVYKYERAVRVVCHSTRRLLLDSIVTNIYKKTETESLRKKLSDSADKLAEANQQQTINQATIESLASENRDLKKRLKAYILEEELQQVLNQEQLF